MGFIDFTNGEVLTADQMDLVMRQGVMRFADATARDTALSAVLAEGMMAYLDDTNEVLKYDGASWVAVGGASPITTEGDLIIGDGSGEDSRLAIGSANTVLTSNGTTATWQDAGAGINYTLVDSGSLPTGVSTFTVTGLGGLDNYLIQLKDVTCDTAFGELRLDTFNSAAQSAEVTDMEIRYSSTGMNYITPGHDILIRLGKSNNIGDTMFATLHLRGCSGNGIGEVDSIGLSNGNGGGATSFIQKGYFEKSSLPLDSIRLIYSSGNFSGGTYEIWGA